METMNMNDMARSSAVKGSREVVFVFVFSAI